MTVNDICQHTALHLVSLLDRKYSGEVIVKVNLHNGGITRSRVIHEEEMCSKDPKERTDY